MKGNIMLVSAIEGKKCTCVNYLLLDNDYLIKKDNAKGFVYLTTFTNKSIVHDLTEKDFLQVLQCNFKEVQDFKNPLNTSLKIESIVLKSGQVISLL